MKVVYLCHPFNGDIPSNRERVRRFCLAVKREVVPIAPHLMLPHYIDEATERELALRHGLALLRLADEVWVLSDRISPGMQGEIVEARKLGIPVRRIQEALPPPPSCVESCLITSPPPKVNGAVGK